MFAALRDYRDRVYCIMIVYFVFFLLVLEMKTKATFKYFFLIIDCTPLGIKALPYVKYKVITKVMIVNVLACVQWDSTTKQTLQIYLNQRDII